MVSPAGSSRKLKEEPIDLAAAKAGRLAEFVSRVVVAKETIHRNCVSFAGFMAGDLALGASSPGMKVAVDESDEVSPFGLQSGDTHLVYLADEKTRVHAVVGTNHPNEHLAVWGENSPLAIGDNIDMLDAYRATNIRKVDNFRFSYKQ